MIGRLRGILLEKTPPTLLLEVGGVAYEVYAPMFTFYRLPELGQETTLHTQFIVREDSQTLYGFYQETERTLFRHLIKVSGIGPKLAISILSGIEPEHFVDCIIQADSKSLIGIPGVGRKTAERLLIEMRDRLTDWQMSDHSIMQKTTMNHSDQLFQEALAALIALGYKPNEARQAIKPIVPHHHTSEELIRHALRSMIRGSSA